MGSGSIHRSLKKCLFCFVEGGKSRIVQALTVATAVC